MLSQQQHLKKQYDYPIIPYNHPVVIEAGYTLADTQKAQVFSGPVYDEKFFYYCTYSGNLFAGTFKNGLLICRKKKDGALVYVVNCQNFNLDRGDNIAGPSRMVCRTLPVIKGDRLYLTSDWISNIGPQVFCVDKRTGAKIYSIAYYLPDEVKDVYGTDFLTSDNDYSPFKGSNARVNTLDLVVDKGRIYAGSSSFQNFLNPGLIPGGIHFTGYPFFTDQGTLTVIKESFNAAIVESRTFTCAPEFKIGDVLSLIDPEKNPFTPGSNEVLIATTTGGSITSPGSIDGIFYFAQRSNAAPVAPLNFAPFWSAIGAAITVYGGELQSSGLTLAQAVLYINSNPAVASWLLTASLPSAALIENTLGTGDFLVWYIKRLVPGDVVINKYDANGLGYWGNSTWGSKPNLECERITYGTGQSHSVPVSERLLFNTEETNYRLLKRKLVDLSNLYVANPSPASLHLLNQEKISFNKKVRELALLDFRSPRGQRSYSDAILSSSIKDGELLFGVRSVPSDVYTFLGPADPLFILVLPSQDIDGDLASSVFSNDCLVSATSKNGGLLTLNLSHWRRDKWTHSCPRDVGINVEPIVYTGPNGLLGGTIYVSTSKKRCDNLHILALSSNTSFNDGSRGTDPSQLEQFVTQNGEFIPSPFSFVYSYDQDEARVSWNTKLDATGYGTVTAVDGLLLTSDNGGHLHVLNSKTGERLQTINSGTSSHSMKGGIASPSVDGSQVFWIASYDAPGAPQTAGAYGWTLLLR